MHDRSLDIFDRFNVSTPIWIQYDKMPLAIICTRLGNRTLKFGDGE